MLTQGQATLLENRLERVSCVDPKLADGLFTYVLKGEPSQDEPHYEQHLNKCEYCRVALEILRYRRDVAKLIGRKIDDSASG